MSSTPTARGSAIWSEGSVWSHEQPSKVVSGLGRRTPRRNAHGSTGRPIGCGIVRRNWKRRWKIVRTDNFTDVPGEIIVADEDTGECSMQVGGETKTLSFGPGGMRIVGRR